MANNFFYIYIYKIVVRQVYCRRNDCLIGLLLWFLLFQSGAKEKERRIMKQAC